MQRDFVWVHEPCFGEGSVATTLDRDNDKAAEAPWTAFPQCDQDRLDAAVTTGKVVDSARARPVDFHQDEVCVYGCRWIVDIRAGKLTARFWRAQPKRVARALWHKEGVPYTEEESIMIDNWAKSTIITTTPLALPDGNRRIELNPETREIVEVVNTMGWFLSPKTPITRGWPGVPVHGDSAAPVTNLVRKAWQILQWGIVAHQVICIHGIGEHLWSQQAFSQLGLVEQCRGLRSMVNEEGAATRIEFLPVEWHSVIHTQGDAVQRQLEAITLPSVPMLRTMTNDCISDVLFYQGSEYQFRIREAVVQNINNTVRSYLAALGPSNPPVRVSFICHSLGSVIIYDILQRQKDATIPPKERLDFGPQCPVAVASLFLIGSPVALFLTCRGSCADIIPEHICARMFNVFNPTDPVAYRLEPLLSLRMKDAPPEHVPDYSGGGGVKAHVQLKGVMKAFADSAYDVATKDGGIKKAFIAPMKSLLGLDADEVASLQTATESIKAINGGERIDWELQEGLIESANDYVTAVVSHNRYFNNADFAAFVKAKLLMTFSSSSA